MFRMHSLFQGEPFGRSDSKKLRTEVGCASLTLSLNLGICHGTEVGFKIVQNGASN